MSELKILIVEDEPIIADDIQFILEEMGYTESTIVHTGEEAILLLDKTHVDLVLLDINLASSLDGVQVAEYICENKGIPFIFLTSLSDDSTIERVKKTQPSGYMVKPIDEKTLKVNIELALTKGILKTGTKQSFSDVYYVKDKIRMTKVYVSDIMYLEGSSNYTIIHCKEKKFVVSQTMKKVHANLDPSIFLRIHKSYIINMNEIEYIEDAHVVMGQHKLGISRTYREIFQTKLNML